MHIDTRASTQTRYIVLLSATVLLAAACGSPTTSSKPFTLYREYGGHLSGVRSIAWSLDGGYIATSSRATNVQVWDTTSGGRAATLSGFRGSIVDTAWSPSGDLLATGSAEPRDTLRVWSVGDWRQLYTLNTDPTNFVTSLDWSPDGKSLAAGIASDKVPDSVEIWDISSKQLTAKLVHVGGVDDVVWSPDGKQIAFTSLAPSAPGQTNGSVVIWDIAQGDGPSTDDNTVTLTGFQDLVTSVAWSPDGKSVVAGVWDGMVQVWDVTTQQNVTMLTGHTDIVESVAWSPDGEHIASGSSRLDTTLRIWDAASGALLATLPHPDGVNRLAWSPDSILLASGCQDGQVRLWNVK